MRILLAGIGKNIQKSLGAIQDTFSSLASKFECAAVFYENNSSDNSAELLQEWKKQDSRIHVTSETIPFQESLNRCKARTWDNQPCRMELLAEARNKLLDRIMTPAFEGYDLVLMFDLDIVRPLPLSETADAIRTFPSDAAGVFSFGVNTAGKMYDLYTYRDVPFPFGPEIIGEHFFSNKHEKKLYRHTDGLKRHEFYPVYCAFNGAALYRREYLQGCRYSAYPNQDLDNLYRKIASDMGKEPSNWFTGQTHINSVLQGAYLFGEDGFFYQNNAGYDYPIIIEHAALHATLIKKGKLYLRPPWVHQSQNHDGYLFWHERLMRILSTAKRKQDENLV